MVPRVVPRGQRLIPEPTRNPQTCSSGHGDPRRADRIRGSEALFHRVCDKGNRRRKRGCGGKGGLRLRCWTRRSMGHSLTSLLGGAGAGLHPNLIFHAYSSWMRHTAAESGTPPLAGGRDVRSRVWNAMPERRWCGPLRGPQVHVHPTHSNMSTTVPPRGFWQCIRSTFAMFGHGVGSMFKMLLAFWCARRRGGSRVSDHELAAPLCWSCCGRPCWPGTEPFHRAR